MMPTTAAMATGVHIWVNTSPPVTVNVNWTDLETEPLTPVMLITYVPGLTSAEVVTRSFELAVPSGDGITMFGSSMGEIWGDGLDA